MKIGKLTTIVSFAALLAASQALASDGGSFNGGAEDETGFLSIGTDISRAGTTPDSVRQFVAGLTPDATRGLERGCQTAQIDPAGYHANVRQFCQNLEGSGVVGNEALGFMAPETSQNPLASPAPAY